MKPFQKILVPIDFSAHADAALDAALDLAARYEATITLVNVFEPIALAFPEGSGIYAGIQIEEALEETTKALDKKKAEAAAKARRAVDAVQRHGSPPREIIDFARSHHIDLIVMGTHGRTGLAHMFIGSVAERVVRMAPCAVLTVHADKKA